MPANSRPAPGALAPQRAERTPPSTGKPSVAVLGAGSSGLVTLKVLLEHGLEATCFEQHQHVGGLWVQQSAQAHAGIYDSLHINTSTRQTQFSDFPFPAHLGDFPHHTHLARYFADYAAHFGLYERIHFGHHVSRCEPLESGGYRLLFSGPNQSPRSFDAVVVANGHHFSPLLPEREKYQDFSGQILHSSAYKNPDHPVSLRGRRVVVVGIGNSAMDIACELGRSGASSHVTLSTRRGAWIMPKYLRGQPIDGPAFFPHWLPARLRQRLVTRAFCWLYGNMRDFGLPEPEHLIGQTHPTVSTEFPVMVKSGDIVVKPGFTRAQGDRVFFSDHSSIEADAVIFCTGYRVAFPFFEATHIEAPDNILPLYFRTFHPQLRHVFFVGLLQTIGAVMPVAEAQAGAIAKHLGGAYNLPSQAEMRIAIARYDQQMKARFIPSLRHTMQVIPEDFHRALNLELRRGQKRARRQQGLAFSFSGAP